MLYRLEDLVRSLPQRELETHHNFSPGIYARTIMIPKGTLMTGMVHKHDDLQIMVGGDISVMCENGTSRLKGLNIFTSRAGFKNVGYAHEDTTWITVHRTDETDLAMIEKEQYEEEEPTRDYATGKILPGILKEGETDAELYEGALKALQGYLCQES